LRVTAATICGTDIRIFRGRKTAGVRYPSVLGHEFSGEIIETGGHPGLKVGDRIGVCPALPCGRCHLCKSGGENLCADGENIGYEIDGAFADYIRIPAQAVCAGNIRHLPDDMSHLEASLVEPLACVSNGQELVGVRAGDCVLILGAGPIGLMHLLLARMRGAAQIVISEPNPLRRAAASEFGADAVIDPSNENLHRRVLDLTDGRGADVVICAIGVPALAAQSLELAAKHDRISLFAGFSKDDMATLDVNAIHYRELTMVGAFGLTRRQYDLAFDLIAKRHLEIDPLITHRFPLEGVLDAFQMAESGRALKVAIAKN